MKIAIRFHDKDFYYYTFRNALLFLNEILTKREEGRGILSKKEILLIINNLSYACYLGFQIQYNEDGTINSDYSNIDHTKSYIKISDENLYVYEEAEKLTQNRYKDFNTILDILMLDTDFNYLGISPIYLL
jgi:hypothetical protein